MENASKVFVYKGNSKEGGVRTTKTKKISKELVMCGDVK